MNLTLDNFTEGNHSVDADEYRLESFVRSLGIFIGIFDICVGSVGNLLTIIAILTNKKLQNSFYMFIASLCLVDFLTATAMIPFNVTSYITKKWIFGEDNFTCSVMAWSYYSCGYSSIVCLLIITLNRYVGIVHPNHYDTLFSNKRAWMTIVISWLVAPVLLSPFFFFNNYKGYGWFQGVTLCVFLIKGYSPQQMTYMNFIRVMFQAVPLFCMVIMYSVIFRTVQKSGTEVIKMSIRSAKSGDFSSVTSRKSSGGSFHQDRPGYTPRISSYRRLRSFSFNSGKRQRFTPKQEEVEESQRCACCRIWCCKSSVVGDGDDEVYVRSNRADIIENNNIANDALPLVHVAKTATLTKFDSSSGRNNDTGLSFNKPKDNILPLPDKTVEINESNGESLHQRNCSHDSGCASDTHSICGESALLKADQNDEEEAKSDGEFEKNGTLRSNNNRHPPLTKRNSQSAGELCVSPGRYTRSPSRTCPTMQYTSGHFESFYNARVLHRNDSSVSQKSKIVKPCDRRYGRQRSYTVMEIAAKQRRVMDRRLLRISVTICTVFMILFLPSVIINLSTNAKNYPPSVHMLASIITWFNSCVNPIIYCFMNPKLRIEYSRILKKVTRVVLRCFGMKTEEEEDPRKRSFNRSPRLL